LLSVSQKRLPNAGPSASSYAMRIQPIVRGLPSGHSADSVTARFLLHRVPAHRPRRPHRLQGSAHIVVFIPEWSHSSRAFGSGPPVLRRLRVRAAQAVPALLRDVPERTDRQPGCALCHSGGSGAVPCVLWVDGEVGRARRALGAVPACACPVPCRRGTLPRRPDTRAGGRSAAYRHACSPTAVLLRGWATCCACAAHAATECPYAAVACRHCGARVERGIMEVA